MSLNRILHSAQKLGMPVVITDRDGFNAQVVLPFDDFMALTGASSHAVSEKQHAVPSDTHVHVDVQTDTDDTAWDLSDFDFPNDEAVPAVSQDPFDFTVEAPLDPTNESLGESQSEGVVSDMEERFYLEPLNETDPLK